MAAYKCVIRTNWFHVKNEDKFKEFISNVYTAGGTVDIFERTASNGKKLFCFTSPEGISGMVNIEDDEEFDASAYDAFVKGLQEHIADNDAVIIQEVGHEGCKYVVGLAEIITKNDYRRFDMGFQAIRIAAQMLNNPNYKTTCEY